jgi:hypothetical protein
MGNATSLKESFCTWWNPDASEKTIFCAKVQPSYCEKLKSEAFSCNLWHTERYGKQQEIIAAFHHYNVVVAHGPSGVGKTEIAAHYACSADTAYDHIWWIGAMGKQSVEYAYRDFLAEQGIALAANASIEELKKQINKVISPCSGNWLVVYDRFEEHKFKELLSDAPWNVKSEKKWHVLVTSQEPIIGFVQDIPVSTFQRNETLHYYAHWATQVAGFNPAFKSVPPTDIESLATAMGDHPFLFSTALWIALEQALTISAFLKHYQTLYAKGEEVHHTQRFV